MGSGWLGLPLAEHFVSMGYHVKASTTSESRLPELTSISVEPFILDLGNLPNNLQDFLQTNVLIINIPSKDIDAFGNLAREIEKSTVEKVLFVSSTSVYENKNKTVFEYDGAESQLSPLFTIENLLRKIPEVETTIIRFGGLIGYSRNPGKFLSKGRIVQDPDSNVNLIHRDDCIGIISQIVEQDVWGEVFNCCADTHPTKREFYTQATQSLGLPAPEFAKTGDKSYKIVSNQKVKKVLNYIFLHPDLLDIKFEKNIE